MELMASKRLASLRGTKREITRLRPWQSHCQVAETSPVQLDANVTGIRDATIIYTF